MKTYNISPYFDDFNEFKNYHQILFKPGVAVQARELTQLQTILRNQVEKFGNHIFQHGSIVIPGNSYFNDGVDYIRVVGVSGASVVPVAVGSVIQGSNGANASVLAMQKLNRPDTSGNISDEYLVAVSYKAPGVVAGVQVPTFQVNETITRTSGSDSTLGTDAPLFQVGPNNTDIGKLTMAFINDGVYYINGTFVTVPKQSVIINPDSNDSTKLNSVTASVILKIEETIVTADEEEDLLDPAQGSHNYAAPGADRVMIQLKLQSIDTTSTGGAFTSSSDCVEIMRFQDGVLLEHATRPKYSELDKSLAKRTYDQAGDYIVDGFDIKVQEALKLANNGGKYKADTGFGSAYELGNQLIYSLSAGSAYVQGFNVETIATSLIPTQKPRDKTEFRNVSRRISYGNYVLGNVLGAFAGSGLMAGDVISFHDSSNAKIGEAIFCTMDYYVGADWATGLKVDKIYFTDFTYTDTTKTLDNCSIIKAGSITIARMVYELKVSGPTTQTWTTGVADAPLNHLTLLGYSGNTGAVYTYKSSGAVDLGIPQTGFVISRGGTSANIMSRDLLFSESSDSLIHYLGSKGLKSTKTQLGQADIVTTTWEKLTITAGQTNSNTVSPGGTIVGLDDGVFTVFNSTGAISSAGYTMNPSGTGVVSPTAVASTTVCYVQVRKVGAAPRMKHLVTDHTEGFTYSGPDYARAVKFNKYDAVYIKSLTVNGVERVNDFSLVRNTSDFSYKNSYAKLRDGLSGIRSGDWIVIIYSYLMHDTGSTSNYFSADSYINIPDYYIESRYVNGVEISLRDCVDFRNTAYGDPNNFTKPMVSGSTVSTTAEFYLPRYDLLTLTPEGKLNLVVGTPAAIPIPPQAQAGAYPIYKIYLPPYVYNVDDVVVTKVSTDVYTMKKIDHMADRIDRLEEFSLLTFSEIQTLQANVTDANTGLDKFKTGYLVENLKDPFVVADATANGYMASCSPTLGIYCGLDKENIDLTMYIDDSALQYVEFNPNGNFLSQKFTEEVFASNTLSSGVVNINPFNIASYEGDLTMQPSQDFWAETLSLPEITIRKQGLTWDYLPGTIPQSSESYNPDVQAAYTNGTIYSLGDSGVARASGPSTLSIDTIMGWESRTKNMSPDISLSEEEKAAMAKGLVIYGETNDGNRNANQASIELFWGRITYDQYLKALGITRTGIWSR